MSEEENKPNLKVISFNKKAPPKQEELKNSDADQILTNCIGKYKEVVVIGWEPSDELKLVTSSRLQLAEATLMLDLAKITLIDSMFEEEYE